MPRKKQTLREKYRELSQLKEHPTSFTAKIKHQTPVGAGYFPSVEQQIETQRKQAVETVKEGIRERATPKDRPLMKKAQEDAYRRLFRWGKK